MSVGRLRKIDCSPRWVVKLQEAFKLKAESYDGSTLGDEIIQTTPKEQRKSVQERFDTGEHHALNIDIWVKLVIPFIFTVIQRVKKLTVQA